MTFSPADQPEAPPPARNAHTANTTPMPMSVRLKVRALLLRASPRMPRPVVRRAPSTSTHAGYEPIRAEKKPLTRAEKPSDIWKSLGYMSSSSTSHVTGVQKRTQFL